MPLLLLIGAGAFPVSAGINRGVATDTDVIVGIPRERGD